MDVIELNDDSGFSKWNDYVISRTGSVMDVPGWSRVVQDTYRIEPVCFAAVDQGKIEGILSMVEIRHPLFGHYLSTAPFGTDGGLVAERPEAEHALLEAAKARAKKLNVDHLLIRTRADLSGFRQEKRYVTAILDLSKGEEAIWANLPAKTRNQIRRGQKENFRLMSGPHEMETFYRLFQRHMRDLGSPGHCFRFYENILRHLPDKTHFQIVWDGSKPVAGSLLFIVNKTAMNLQTVSLKKYSTRCANYFLYWSMVLFALEKGCTQLDMGRSLEGSGTLLFKQNWKPKVVPLAYNYYLPKEGPIPFLDPRNAKFQLAVGVWKRLPLFLTKQVGPHLIKGLV